MNIRCDIVEKKTKDHPPRGDDASTAKADLGRVGRDEQGEAHGANIMPDGGLHLKLGSLRLKPDLNLTFPLLKHGQHVLYIHI